MNSLTKRVIQLLLILPLAFFHNSISAQFDCAGAQTLVLDVTCVDENTAAPNSGDPTGNDLVDGNVCSSNYSGGDDYIFTYTATSTDALDLDLFATNTWTGLLVTEGCPTTGSCVASSTSSSSDESLVTPPLTNGSTYYIQISTWPSPQSAGQFCLNAALVPPPMPPANDECAGAFPVTVNPDENCTAVTNGTIALATASPEDPSACGGTEDDDVWFSFVATATTHTISLINLTSGTTDLYHSLWTGGCGSLTNTGLCSDPNTSLATGLTIGVTYFLRVYSWTSATGQTTIFDVCIGTPLPPPANDVCSGAIAYPGTIGANGTCPGNNVSLDLSPYNNATSFPACDGSGNYNAWFTFTAPAANLIFTSGTGLPGIAIYSGACGATTELACLNNVSGDISGLTPGANYLMEIWDDTDNSGTVTWCLEEAPLPPANDACAGAESIMDGIPITGNSTNSTNVEGLSPCSGGGGSGLCAVGGGGSIDFSPGVWFVYTSGSAGESIIVDTDNAGTDFDTEIQVFEGTCGSLVCVGGDDDSGAGATSEFCWETSGVGITYYIYVDGHGGAIGNFEVLLTKLAPANDECATAAVLAMNTTGSLIDQSFGGATASGMGAEACDSGATPTPADVWYSINTDADGGDLIVIVEPGPNSDVVVAIYDACGSPFPEQCVDTGGNGSTETINFFANFQNDKGNESSTRDATYFVRVYEKVASGEVFEIGAQGAALPIVLGSFEAKSEKRGNKVLWSTLSEINSDFVEVQSSPNGSTKWETIGKVATMGESSSRLDYELFDYNPYEVTYYRLNAVDKDGKSELSHVINVRRSDVVGKMTLSPNPANATISLQTTSNIEEIGMISVIDMTGKVMKRESISLRKGLNTYSLDLEDLNAGLYLFTLQTEEGTKVEKFVKQ